MKGGAWIHTISDLYKKRNTVHFPRLQIISNTKCKKWWRWHACHYFPATSAQGGILHETATTEVALCAPLLVTGSLRCICRHNSPAPCNIKPRDDCEWLAGKEPMKTWGLFGQIRPSSVNTDSCQQTTILPLWKVSRPASSPGCLWAPAEQEPGWTPRSPLWRPSSAAKSRVENH